MLLTWGDAVRTDLEKVFFCVVVGWFCVFFFLYASWWIRVQGTHKLSTQWSSHQGPIVVNLCCTFFYLLSFFFFSTLLYPKSCHCFLHLILLRPLESCSSPLFVAILHNTFVLFPEWFYIKPHHEYTVIKSLTCQIEANKSTDEHRES